MVDKDQTHTQEHKTSSQQNCYSICNTFSFQKRHFHKHIVGKISPRKETKLISNCIITVPFIHSRKTDIQQDETQIDMNSEANHTTYRNHYQQRMKVVVSNDQDSPDYDSEVVIQNPKLETQKPQIFIETINKRVQYQKKINRIRLFTKIEYGIASRIMLYALTSGL